MIKVEMEIYLLETGMKRVNDENERESLVLEGTNILLKRFLSMSDIMSNIKGTADWFLTGDSKEDALKKKVISQGMVTPKASQLMSKDLMNDYALVVKKIWNKNMDSILCLNYIQSDINKFSYVITFKVKDQKQAREYVPEIVRHLINDLSPRIVKVETNDYSLNEHQVFPDRLPVGWMFYINNVYDENILGLGKRMHTLAKGGKTVGTLFLTKPDFFDGSDKSDIALANDLEIALAGHDILPTYRNIF